MTTTPATPPVRWLGLPRMAYPAIGAIALCASLGTLVLLWNSEQVKERYIRLTEAALERGDAATALVGAARLLELPGSSREAGFLFLARAHLANGNAREASAIIDWIAPTDKAVFAPAHLFVATQILESASSDPALLRLARRQALNALSLQPDAPEALRIFGRVAARQRSWVEARQAFEKAAAKDPSAVVELIPVLKILGDQKGLEKWSTPATAD